MTEIWRPIAGYEGLYEISSLGRVRSLDRTVEVPDARWGGIMLRPIRGRPLRPFTDANEYFTVTLCMAGRRWAASVHRLVAGAFCDKPDGCDEVNHKDGAKQNNHSSNLEWTTHQGNCEHAVENGLTKKRKRIAGTCLKTGAVTEYQSATHAAKAMGQAGCGSISLAATGKLKTTAGHTWRYL